MMKLCLVAALATMAASAALSDDEPVAGQTADRMPTLVGACFANDIFAVEGLDAVCYEPIFDGAFVRALNVRDGDNPLLEERVYSWNGQQQRLEYDAYRHGGERQRAWFELDDGGLRHVDQTLVSGEGGRVVRRLFWRITDAGYDHEVEIVSGEGATSSYSIPYRRNDLSMEGLEKIAAERLDQASPDSTDGRVVRRVRPPNPQNEPD